MSRSEALVVAGLSHRTAALAAREQVALDDRAARAVLRTLRDDPAVREAVVLSTCNRTEIYAVGAGAREAEEATRRALLAHTPLGAATLSCAGYVLHELDAAEHLFRVTAGLESAVLGETEIGGQVRAAARRAREEEALGPLLSGAFERALAAAGRVRRRTGISVGATSLASVVGELAAAGAPQPERRVVLLGAGRLAASVAGALAPRAGGGLAVLNRGTTAARALAGHHHAQAAGLDALAAELARADALVCATGAPDALVTAAGVARALAARPARPLVIIDLAVPRDVEPAAAAVPGVTVHDIDAVQRLVGRNLAARRDEAARAGELVRREVARFDAWRRERAAEPLVRSLWRRAELARRAEVARAAAGLGPEERERLDRVTAALVRRMLDEPTERLRTACAGPDGAARLEALWALLGDDGAVAAPNVIPLRERAAQPPARATLSSAHSSAASRSSSAR